MCIKYKHVLFSLELIRRIRKVGEEEIAEEYYEEYEEEVLEEEPVEEGTTPTPPEVESIEE